MNEVPSVIVLSEEEHQRASQLAQQRGYTTLEAYVRALIDADAEQQGIEHDTSLDIRTSIRQGLREAFRGEYVPLETLWTDDDE